MTEILIVLGFVAAAIAMGWDIFRQCEKAQYEVDLDELWDDDEDDDLVERPALRVVA